MNKKICISLALSIIMLCGCSGKPQTQTQTRLLLDTVTTFTADCDEETLNGAFLLCEKYEKLLSRTVEESDVYKLNNSKGFIKVSDDTVKITERALYYGKLSDGRFDITVCPVSSLWDFNKDVLPNKDEIADALKNVDYGSIEIKNGEISTGGKKIDLGGIAKGYIADRLVDYFKEKGVKNALISLGGNVAMTGEYTVGIKKPFSDDLIGTVKLKDKSAVTSGIDQRYIEKDGVIYHHVIDPETGYGVDNELASVTVIGDCSLDCDALSTVCLLCGSEKGTDIIENTANTEAVFISRDGKITLTSGLYREDKNIYFKR